MNNVSIMIDDMKDFSISKFLWDIFVCSLMAFSGPEFHHSVLLKKLVIDRNYISENDFLELIALTTFLPGPSSTQTVISIGYKKGGIRLGLLSMIIWVLPSFCMMIALSFLFLKLYIFYPSGNFLRFMPSMVVAFLLYSVYIFGRKFIRSISKLFLFSLALFVTLFIRSIWVFPILMLFGASVLVFLNNNRNINSIEFNSKPKIGYLSIGVLLALILPILAFVFSNNILIKLLDIFYRFGYVIIGGGQVAVPIMFNTIVEGNGYLTSSEFMAGYGFVQAIPGPMYSFSSFVGSFVLKDWGVAYQILGGFLIGIAVFLPGVLLILFVYPLWEDIKKNNIISIGVSGINAVACGFIASMCVLLFMDNVVSVVDLVVLFATFGALFSRRFPPSFIVLLVILLGILV